MTHRKKLIEVALPLEAINVASAREKSIRHGHPSTLHLWWARRPLAAARAVIFTSLVDDPDDPNALPAFVDACNKLPIGANVKANGDTPRMRLFDFIERLVTWEATTDEEILNTARDLIMIATEGHPPPLLDPFAGGGSIPLEAQRLGLEAHASDLNPVAVMINKAQIEIPPRFANRPPVNPRDTPLTLNPSPTVRSSRGEGLENTPPSPTISGGEGNHTPLSSRSVGEGSGVRGEGSGGEGKEHWHISPAMNQRMTEIARHLRRQATKSEDILWQALRNRKFDEKKFKRQVDVGAFVLDFYCAEQRLAVEVDGSIHALQHDADQQRQSLIESLGIRFVRLTAELVETNLPEALKRIQSAFKANTQTVLPLSSRSVGEGAGGEGDTTYRGAAGLAADVRYYGEWMREKAWEKIGHLYPPLIPGPSPTASGGEGDKTPLSSRSAGEGNKTPLSPRSVGEGQGVRGETVIAWLWARTVQSPNPAVNAQVPLVRSFILSKKKGRECWAKPIVEPLTLNPSPTTSRGEGLENSPSPHNVWERGPGGEGQPTHTIRFEVTPGLPPKGQDGTMISRQGGICIVSGVPIPKDHIKAEGMAGRMGAMLMAIVTEGRGGRSYYSPDESHVRIAESAVPEWEPVGQIPDDKRSMFTPLYGLTQFRDLFTPRQLVALTTFSDLVAEAREQAYTDARAAGLPDDGIPLRDGGRGALAYAEAVSVYLAFAVDRLVERSSTIATWQSSADFIRGTFGRQAIPMVWDFAEGNPFSSSTGNFKDNAEWVAKATESIKFKSSTSHSFNIVKQEDAANAAKTLVMAISTDPPYYDNIGYADLSDFFYVWLRKMLREVYPDIFGTLLVPKEPELIASPYRHGGKEAANAHFENGMHQTFTSLRRFISHEYPLTVYYAFKQQDSEADEEEPLTLNPSPTARSSRGEGPKSQGLDPDDETPLASRSVGEGPGVRASTGWETMLTSLIDSGFSIDGTWPMRTERSVRSVAIGTNALASSIVLVCRPRPVEAPNSSRRAFVSELRRELPNALKQMQSGNIAPVDLAQASIGPGMAIYSRYSNVLEADGRAMSVRAALGLINQELDTYLAEQDGDIDTDTRFAVAWFEQFGFNEGEFGMADTLARAKNTSVAGVEAAQLVVCGRGKVQLIPWRDYDPGAWDPTADKRPTVWEATHHLIERLNTHGETGSAMLMEKMPSDMAAEARNLAYRLYSICERKGWADHARDYNALVISWSGIGEEAARLKQQREAGDATHQTSFLDD